MKIYKYLDSVGTWICDWRDKTGHYFLATGDSKLEAIDRMFKKLKWAEIGNWSKN